MDGRSHAVWLARVGQVERREGSGRGDGKATLGAGSVGLKQKGVSFLTRPSDSQSPIVLASSQSVYWGGRQGGRVAVGRWCGVLRTLSNASTSYSSSDISATRHSPAWLAWSTHPLFALQTPTKLRLSPIVKWELLPAHSTVFYEAALGGGLRAAQRIRHALENAREF